MLLRLTEGVLFPMDCSGRKCTECPQKENCATIQIWTQLGDAINQVVDNITLADMVAWELEKQKN